MKIFISWSGEISRQMAEALRDWLPDVIPGIETPFMSEHIDKGKRGMDEIANQLASTNIGIICVTPDNKEAPWLNFEAGALSRPNNVESHVCTFLLGIEKRDLNGPLGQFQHTSYDKEDIKKLIETIDKKTEKPTSSERLSKRLEKYWTEINVKLQSLEKLTQKTIVWVHESDEVNLEEEINQVERSISLSNSRIWYIYKQEKPVEGDIFIYVYEKIDDSIKNIEKLIEHTNSIQGVTHIIPYTEYANEVDGDRFIPDSAMKQLTKNNATMPTNFVDSLIRKIKEII